MRCIENYDLSTTVFINFIIIVHILNCIQCDYWSDRANFIENENKQAIGGAIKLTSKENQVNKILMKYKWKECDDGFRSPKHFPPAQHFFHSKQKIEQSNVYRFLQKLPKGASLHSHSTALISEEFLYNLTFRDDLYGCVVNDRLKLHFFAPNHTDTQCNWRLLKELRKENSTFDDFVKTQLTMFVDNPAEVYPDSTAAWNRLDVIFATVSTFLTYKPVFQEYFYQALKELYEDNVMYLEFRATLKDVYDLNGTKYSSAETVQFYIETLEQFKRDYPDFYGARIIYARPRDVDNQTANNYIKIAKQLKAFYPNFVAGFDLIGQEDKGKPLDAFIAQLLEISSEMKFFFHAGETNWNGVSTDFNLVDAILLNTTRIGHGYAVGKHPKVLELIKQKGIALEISPISNQVLKLVDDLRNHPATALIASGYPVVICCDDPSFWGAKALSYDWYMALMGLASREADLKFLKQLAINSIIYSAMEYDEKINALSIWQQRWEQFLDNALMEFNNMI